MTKDGNYQTQDSYESVLTALCIYREARNCDRDAMAGVVNVIHNRCCDGKSRWPRTLAGVILQRMQFSSFNPGSNPDAVFPVPNSPEWPAWLTCCDVVDTALFQPDPTDGAQYYHSIPANQPWPQWAHDFKQTAHIGPLYFFREE